MARTKMTARLSTGGMAPRALLGQLDTIRARFQERLQARRLPESVIAEVMKAFQEVSGDLLPRAESPSEKESTEKEPPSKKRRRDDVSSDAPLDTRSN
jgi:hypothetical protein